MTTGSEQRAGIGQLLSPEIAAMLETGQRDQARSALVDLLDPEVGEVIEALAHEQRVVAFQLLPLERAAEVYALLPTDVQEDLLEELGHDQVAPVVNEMDPDDRVELIEDLAPEQADELLSRLQPEERRETEEILTHPEESVGRLITPDYLTLRPEWTVRQALDHPRQHGRDAETLHTLYVVDDHGRLLDHLQLGDLVLAGPLDRCEALRRGQTVSLRANDDREEAVKVMERYDLPVVPVVDEQSTLVGVVTFDDVADVAEEEVTEDIHKMGGMEALEYPYLSATIMELVRKRGLLLALMFVFGMLTVIAMGVFRGPIENIPILALFVPLIMASGGNSGSQAASLVIRALALGEVNLRDWFRVLRRELISGLILGSILGATGMVLATLVAMLVLDTDVAAPGGAVWTGFSIGTAIVGVVMVGTLTGSMLPIIMQRIGLDPAASSTPFVTTIVDVAGLLIYFGLAVLLLQL